MRKTILTIVCAAGFVCYAMSTRPAGAVPALSAQQTALPAAPVKRVANVCGRNGCVAVQTKRVVHTKPGSVAAKHI